MQAELGTGIVDVAQDALRTTVVKDLRSRVAGNVLGAAIPVGDSTVTVDEVHSVGDLVEQVHVEILVHCPPPVPRAELDADG